jgi:hypothetical protein
MCRGKFSFDRDRWSAASEGVPAALRCRKAHRARTRCTSRTRPGLPSQTRPLSIVSGHNRSFLRMTSQICAILLIFGRTSRQKSYFWPGNCENGSYTCDNATGQHSFTNAMAIHGRIRKLIARDNYLRGASSAACRNASTRLRSSARPKPAMSNAVPWSTDVRTTGRPTVMFTPASSPSTFTGPWPWS